MSRNYWLILLIYFNSCFVTLTDSFYVAIKIKIFERKWQTKLQITKSNSFSSCAPAPVHQELDEDNEDTDQHDHPHHDQTPPEHWETVGLRVSFFVITQIRVTWPGTRVSVPGAGNRNTSWNNFGWILLRTCLWHLLVFWILQAQPRSRTHGGLLSHSENYKNLMNWWIIFRQSPEIDCLSHVIWKLLQRIMHKVCLLQFQKLNVWVSISRAETWNSLP